MNTVSGRLPERIEQRVPDQFHFVVTGFGPFQNVSSNPTMTLVESLATYVEKNHPEIRSDRISTCILETSSHAIHNDLDEFLKKVRRSRVSDKNTQIVLLHLGVAATSVSFRLEACAYNDASFRVPDERQYQPVRQPIVPDLPWNACIENSTLIVSNLVNILNEQQKSRPFSSNAPIVLSYDPGRFVCNYTYFWSLSRHEAAACLFFHVPPFSVASLEEQLEVVCALMKAIEDQLVDRLNNGPFNSQSYG